MNATIKFSKDKFNENKAILNLSGALVLGNIKDIKSRILRHYNKYKMIELKGSSIDDIDLSFIQLVNSLKLSAKKDKKNIITDFEFNEQTMNLIEGAGFNSKLRPL